MTTDFQVGHLVTWREPADHRLGTMSSDLRRRYGEGPFVVAVVEVVPDVCTCGSALDDEYHQYHCPYELDGRRQTRHESVGHHQWVTVMSDKFSGAWFKHA